MCGMSKREVCDKFILMKHLIKNGFPIDYETWVFHGEKYTTVAAEESVNDRVGANRIDEMLEAIWPECDLNTKDPPKQEIEEFFRLLKASEELLHGHTKVAMLTFVTWLMALKSKILLLQQLLQ
jgi:hypothetical protein